MATFITKPEVALREELNRARRPIGNIGGQLSQANTVEDVHAVLGGRKNYIINGAFNIWQRRTAAETIGNNFNCADRWFCYSNQARFERSTNVPYHLGFNYSMKISNFTNTMVLDQPIELPVNGDPWVFAPHRTFTISYWAKATKPVKLYNRIMFRQQGGSSSNEVSPSGMNNVALNNELSQDWRRYSQTYTFPYFTLGSTILCCNLSIRTTTGATQITPTSGTEIYITGIQMEEGPTASPFEHMHIADEMNLCQRYFYKLGGEASSGVGTAYTPSTSEIALQLRHPVRMRAEPTVSFSDDPSYFRFRYIGNNNYVLASGAGLNTTQVTELGGSMWFNSMSHSLNTSGELRTNESNSTDTWIYLSAELGNSA